MMKGIVFFDLDGTLLYNKEGRIPESAMYALGELRKNYKVVLSTGRDMDNHYSSCWRDSLSPDAIIHLNGTKISIGNKIIFEHFMEPSLLQEIYDFSRESGICFGTTIGDRDYYTIPEKRTKADLAFTRDLKRNYHPFTDLIEDHIPVHALSYAGDLENDRPIVKERFPDLDLFGFDSGTGADVVEKGCSKADGMLRICEAFGEDVKDTYAFGDSQNDIAIIERAGTGIAMGNALKELKDHADYVTEPVWDDGIYRACLHFGLIEEMG